MAVALLTAMKPPNESKDPNEVSAPNAVSSSPLLAESEAEDPTNVFLLPTARKETCRCAEVGVLLATGVEVACVKSEEGVAASRRVLASAGSEEGIGLARVAGTHARKEVTTARVAQDSIAADVELRPSTKRPSHRT